MVSFKLMAEKACRIAIVTFCITECYLLVYTIVMETNESDVCE